MNLKDSHKKNRDFYKGKRILLTGASGFKGAWFCSILNYFNADVLGYSLKPEKGCLFEQINGDRLINHIIGDIRDYDMLKKVIIDFNPEIVFHFAALSFVNQCYEHPLSAYSINLMGTVNLLNALRECKDIKSIVIVTTDKVYYNKGDGALYSENDLLGGLSPYAASKTCVEYAIKDFRDTYFSLRQDVGISSIRASNVLAGGDHNKSRLVPTILDSISKGIAVEIRNPNQTRPWQSVFDALDGYMTVGRLMYNDSVKYSNEWNIGPTLDGIKSVQWIFDMIKQSFDNLIEKQVDVLPVKESATLGLNISRMLEYTDWEPRLSFEKVIYQVVDFYKKSCQGENIRDICLNQIIDYYGD